MKLVIFLQICHAFVCVFMVPVRYQLFSTWAQPSSEPAVLFTVCCFSLLEPQQPKPGSPAQGPGRQCQLHFPSCCLREEPIFPSLQHNKGFWLFSASLAIAWDQTPTRLGVVHILAEQSMPLATYIFFFLCRWMDAASKQGEQKVTMRAKSADNRREARSDKGWAGFAAGEACLEQRRKN